MTNTPRRYPRRVLDLRYREHVRVPELVIEFPLESLSSHEMVPQFPTFESALMTMYAPSLNFSMAMILDVPETEPMFTSIVGEPVGNLPESPKQRKRLKLVDNRQIRVVS